MRGAGLDHRDKPGGDNLSSLREWPVRLS